MMEQDRKEYLDKDESEKMCSSKIGEAGEMCSPADTDTCGDCLSLEQPQTGCPCENFCGSGRIKKAK